MRPGGLTKLNAAGQERPGIRPYDVDRCRGGTGGRIIGVFIRKRERRSAKILVRIEWVQLEVEPN
jgi:hypothetical protein